MKNSLYMILQPFGPDERTCVHIDNGGCSARDTPDDVGIISAERNTGYLIKRF